VRLTHSLRALLEPCASPALVAAVEGQHLAQQRHFDFVQHQRVQALGTFGVADVGQIASHRAADALTQCAAGAVRKRSLRRGRYGSLGGRQSGGIHGYFPSHAVRRLRGPLRSLVSVGAFAAWIECRRALGASA